jgi:hypothetical protein
MPLNLPLVSALILLVGPVLSDLKVQRVASISWIAILVYGWCNAFFWNASDAIAFAYSFSILWLGLNFIPDKELALGDKNIALSLCVLIPHFLLPAFGLALSGLMLVTKIYNKPVPFIPLLFLSLCFFLI